MPFYRSQGVQHFAQRRRNVHFQNSGAVRTTKDSKRGEDKLNPTFFHSIGENLVNFRKHCPVFMFSQVYTIFTSRVKK